MEFRQNCDESNSDGVHFFDMLMLVFGGVIENKVEYNKEDKAAGFLKLEKANVNWRLSIDETDALHKCGTQNSIEML